MSRLQNITFHTETGGEQTITVQDYTDTNEPEFYGHPYDEAISGFLRQRFRHLRKNVRISYKACVQQSEFRTLFNNIYNDLFVKGLDVVRYSEGETLTDVHELVPTAQMRQKMQYTHQHGLFLPIMEFKGANAATPGITVEFVDWGLITSAVTESEDYGLITETVTETEDYGTVA